MSEPDSTPTTTIVATRGGTAKTIGLIIGGAVLLGFGLLLTLMYFFVTTSTFVRTAATVPPVVGGIFMIAAGVVRSRAPHAVVVEDAGVQVQYASGQAKFLSWPTLSHAEKESGFAGWTSLHVYDGAGRVVAKLTDSLEPFEPMATAILTRLQRSDDVAHVRSVDRLRYRKNRRVAVFSIIVGTLFLALAAFVTWDGFDQRRRVQLLDEQGVQSEAEIADLLVAPNGVTPRLVYRVETPQGSAERNVEVTRADWEALHGMTTVPVTVVPDEPDYSRTPLEVNADSPIGWLLNIGIVLMPLFFLLSGIFLLLGWDLRTDDLSGKLRLRKLNR